MATLRIMRSSVGAAAYEEVESRAGSGNVKGPDLWEERSYIMQFTDTSWTAAEACNAAGVPAYGSQLGVYNLYVVSKSAAPDPKDQHIVRVKVRWESFKPNERQPHINQTESIWSVQKTLAQYPTEERLDYDLAGKPTQNVVGEPIEPPVTKAVYDDKISISFLTNTSASQYWAGQFKSCINSNAVTLTIGVCPHIYNPGELYLSQVNESTAFDESGSACSSVTLEILGRHNGSNSWYERRPNLSMLKATNATSPHTDPTPIYVKETDPNDNSTRYVYTSSPRYLDASGAIIPVGGSITLNEFSVASTANFSQLLTTKILA